MESGATTDKELSAVTGLTIGTVKQYSNDIRLALRVVGYKVYNRADMMLWLFRPETLRETRTCKITKEAS